MIFKDIKDLKNHKHISVADEYNTFRNYYAEHTNEKYLGQVQQSRGVGHRIYMINRESFIWSTNIC